MYLYSHDVFSWAKIAARQGGANKSETVTAFYRLCTQVTIRVRCCRVGRAATHGFLGRPATGGSRSGGSQAVLCTSITSGVGPISLSFCLCSTAHSSLPSAAMLPPHRCCQLFVNLVLLAPVESSIALVLQNTHTPFEQPHSPGSMPQGPVAGLCGGLACPPALPGALSSHAERALSPSLPPSLLPSSLLLSASKERSRVTLTTPHLTSPQGLLSVLLPDDRRVVAMERHADAHVDVRGIRLTFHWRPEVADEAALSLYNEWSLVRVATSRVKDTHGTIKRQSAHYAHVAVLSSPPAAA